MYCKLEKLKVNKLERVFLFLFFFFLDLSVRYSCCQVNGLRDATINANDMDIAVYKYQA
jgi:hypothetical protein